MIAGTAECLVQRADAPVTKMIDPQWSALALARRAVGTDPQMLEHLTRHRPSPGRIDELAARAWVKPAAVANDPDRF